MGEKESDQLGSYVFVMAEFDDVTVTAMPVTVSVQGTGDGESMGSEGRIEEGLDSDPIQNRRGTRMENDILRRVEMRGTFEDNCLG